MTSPLLEKSMDFATQIVFFYEEFSKSKKDTTIAKQLLRSAASVGANINEAIYGNSKADFISKLHISLKETGESIYWLIVKYSYYRAAHSKPRQCFMHSKETRDVSAAFTGETA